MYHLRRVLAAQHYRIAAVVAVGATAYASALDHNCHIVVTADAAPFVLVVSVCRQHRNAFALRLHTFLILVAQGSNPALNLARFARWSWAGYSADLFLIIPHFYARFCVISADQETN
jgi:hypothetical protein